MPADTSKQIDVVKQRIIALNGEKAAVQKKLDSEQRGLRGWWNGTAFSEQQRSAMYEKKKWLTNAVLMQTAELTLLLAPPPSPPSLLDRMYDASMKLYAVVAFGAVGYGTIVATWRQWTLLRMQYGGLTPQQLHWRKYFLGIGGPFPPLTKKHGLSGAVFLMWYGLCFYPPTDAATSTYTVANTERPLLYCLF